MPIIKWCKNHLLISRPAHFSVIVNIIQYFLHANVNRCGCSIEFERQNHIKSLLEMNICLSYRYSFAEVTMRRERGREKGGGGGERENSEQTKKKPFRVIFFAILYRIRNELVIRERPNRNILNMANWKHHFWFVIFINLSYVFDVVGIVFKSFFVVVLSFSLIPTFPFTCCSHLVFTLSSVSPAFVVFYSISFRSDSIMFKRSNSHRIHLLGQKTQ